MADREHFGSNLTVILAMAGSAIGLGNIWRFPYIAGKYGGAAFILVYIAACIFISVPIFIAEATIGRRSHSNCFGAMKKLAPSPRWKWLGILTVITPLVILSYYSVVGGWSVNYFMVSLVSGFSAYGDSSFASFIGSASRPIVFHTIFLGITALIVMKGIKSGIEKFNKVSLPLLFVMMLLIMVYSLMLPGAKEGVKYLLNPDFHSITPSAIAAALGQSFFSLSLGAGTVLTYASYMKKQENILATGVGTAMGDLLFALIAGFAILPAVFSAGISPGEGPGLIFETLPYIFSRMGMEVPFLSRLISIVFFFSIVMAALTSSISQFEVGVSYLVDEKGCSRRQAVYIVFLFAWFLGAICSLSFGTLSEIKLAGRTIFEFFDQLTSNFLMPLGSILLVIFVGWVMKKADVRDEFTSVGTQTLSGRLFGVFYFLMRYLAPIAILVIFITNLVM